MEELKTLLYEARTQHFTQLDELRSVSFIPCNVYVCKRYIVLGMDGTDPAASLPHI